MLDMNERQHAYHTVHEFNRRQDGSAHVEVQGCYC